MAQGLRAHTGATVQVPAVEVASAAAHRHWVQQSRHRVLLWIASCTFLAWHAGTTALGWLTDPPSSKALPASRNSCCQAWRTLSASAW